MGPRLREFAVWMAVVLLGAYGLWIAFEATYQADNLKPQQAVTFAAIGAIVGWVVAAYIARRNSTKQHTMNLLTQTRISSEMNSRLKIATDTFPVGTPMTATDIQTKTLSHEGIRAALYLLNYYEFLAVALHHGDLDHDLLKDCVRGQLCEMYERFKALIDHVISIDPRGPQQSARFIHLRRLYGAWRSG
jgi:hypothetical protein